MNGSRSAATAVLGGVLAVTAPVFAQTPALGAGQGYPAKSVRFVLPFAAGSAVDALARFYGQRMSENWKQQLNYASGGVGSAQHKANIARIGKVVREAGIEAD